MAQLLALYFDTISKNLCGGINGPEEVQLPNLNQEDAPSIELTVLKRTSYARAPLFEVQQLTGKSLTIAVGTANNVLAQQSSWTIDASGTKFQGTLSLNTAGIAALNDGDEVYLEIIVYDGTSPYRQRFPVRVYKSVLLTSALVAVAGDVALGLLQADRTYMRKEGRAGEGFILRSSDNTKAVFEYLHNDGSRRSEPIS